MDKKVIGVVSLEGSDVLVYDDGSMSKVDYVIGVTEYAIVIPLDMQTTLKPEDVNNPAFAEYPGYIDPATATNGSAPAADQTTGQ